MLCGCYRQTTVILQQGATIPEATIGVPSTASDESTGAAQTDATTVPAETKKPSSGKTQQSNSKPSGSKDTGKESASSAETNVPATEPATLPAETAHATAPPESAGQAAPEPETSAAATETTEPVLTEMTEPAPAQPPVYDISTHRVGSYEKALLEEVNRHRTDAGLPALTMNSKLAALAAIRAYECKQDFSHTRPDGRGWETVLSDYGAAASTENILYASFGTDTALLINTCMDSSTHSQKLMNNQYQTVGIGIYEAGKYVYIVMIFA